jgi:hypothetical protein
MKFQARPAGDIGPLLMGLLIPARFCLQTPACVAKMDALSAEVLAI